MKVTTITDGAGKVLAKVHTRQSGGCGGCLVVLAALVAVVAPAGLPLPLAAFCWFIDALVAIIAVQRWIGPKVSRRASAARSPAPAVPPSPPPRA